MKKISDSEKYYEESKNEIKVAQVLIRLGIIYGHPFVSNFKSDGAFQSMVKEWSNSISHYSYPKLDLTIKKCKLNHKKTITLPEFIECSNDIRYEAVC